MSTTRPARRAIALALAAALAAGAAACSDGGSGTTTGSDLSGSTSPAAQAFAGVQIALQEIASIQAPTSMAPNPVTGDLYVTSQSGTVHRIEVGSDGAGSPTYQLDPTPTLDLNSSTTRRGEQGLLGLAFSPDGTWLYVDYTDKDGNTHIVAYAMHGATADPASARELLHVDQPYANHNGGQLVTGPDGYLYISLGDGGSAGDPDRRAQNTNDLLGKILRIDPTPTADQPYSIPADNPFADGGGRPEVWLYGARNPWRFDFDRQTADLWVADVGQNRTEEVDWLPATPEGAGRGANLGWNFREGDHAYTDANAPSGQAPGDLVEPIFVYGHDDGNCSITGGFVYRGTAIPDLVGAYLYGDYCVSQIRGLLADQGTVLSDRSLGVSVQKNSLSSFGQDLNGELYVLSLAGKVYKVIPA